MFRIKQAMSSPSTVIAVVAPFAAMAGSALAAQPPRQSAPVSETASRALRLAKKNERAIANAELASGRQGRKDVSGAAGPALPEDESAVSGFLFQADPADPYGTITLDNATIDNTPPNLRPTINWHANGVWNWQMGFDVGGGAVGFRGRLRALASP